MKKTMLLSISIMSLLATNAFATHAYRSENCVSESHNLYYKGNYPYGGLYGMTLLNSEDETSALPLAEFKDFEGELEADVLYSIISNEITSEPVDSTDCDFDHTEWKSKTIIEIHTITDEASIKLGLKKR